MILDTQFLGTLVEQDPAARTKAGELDDEDTPTRVPTAVVWELYTGIGNAEDQAKRDTLERGYRRLLRSLPLIELDGDIAVRAGSLRGTHLRSDTLRNLDGADSIVAATALTLGEPVLSNDGDFRDVEDLTVVTF